VLIAANSDPTYKRLVDAMGKPELLHDPRFASIRARGANLATCNESVAEWTRQHDGAEVERLLLAAEVPVSLVYTIADIYQDPHYAAREMLVRVPHPTLGHTTQHGVVPKLSRTPGAIVRSGPELGEDTRTVLAEELGLDAAALDRLAGAGVIVEGASPTVVPTLRDE
jgi:crotonobetainyl-CoA:carnitine CoA-transferase CaiB-like acyl-CoA transferase